MNRSLLFLLLAPILLIPAACDVGNDDDAAGVPTLPPYEDAALDDYGIAVEPDPAVMAGLFEIDVEPVVMVNLLRYRDEAVGEGFEGMTGAEAYQQYISAIVDTQNEIGSRLIWGGSVDAQVVGSSDPVFDSVGLLEYASVDAFFGYAASIPADAAAAREAGLEGQWLIAASTVAEDGGALGDGSACSTWTAEAAAAATGLSEAQVTRLLDGPTDEAVTILDLIRPSGAVADLDAYLDALAEAQADLGARQRWRGTLMLQLLGTASPGVELLMATEYPSRQCALTALADERVTSLADARVSGAELYWIYAATSQDGF
jgi:uncharacterized protein (DUF1330 family)